MERNEIKQNELVLSDEEEKIHKPRMDRRLWLNCNTSKWPINIKKNAICPLKISIDKDLQLELYEIAKTLEYKDIHKVLNICFWPECAATDLLKEKFLDKLLLVDVKPFAVQCASYIQGAYEATYQDIKNTKQLSDMHLDEIRKAAEEFTLIFMRST